MEMFKMTTRLYRFIRDSAKSVERKFTLIRQSLTEARTSSVTPHIANVLIVRNPTYCDLAKVCVVSFLHFHPKSTIKIHVDSATIQKSQIIFRREIHQRRVILIVSDDNSSTWQEIKMKTILGMKESNEFFMDADLRWNGALPELEGVTFFVEEFILGNKSPYAQMLDSSFFAEFGQVSMKNTSFLSWGNYKITQAEKNLVLTIEKNIIKAVNSELVPLDDKSFVKRISEQLALSLFAEKIPESIFFLKANDGHRDGSFLESSYFGATGSRF
jgi:hypothetical protein